MCFEEKTVITKEGVVSLAIEKRVRNKRRRDPDMYMDVLLSSTVKRLKYEIVNEKYGHNKEKRENPARLTKKGIVASKKSNQKQSNELDEVAKAVECLQSTLETLDEEIRSESASKTLLTTAIPSSGFSQTIAKDNAKINDDILCAKPVDSSGTISDSTLTENGTLNGPLKEEDVDFDTLMQSLLEICEPLSCNVDELIKEYSIDPLSSGSFDLLSSNDPFLPGMFEVMCS